MGNTQKNDLMRELGLVVDNRCASRLKPPDKSRGMRRVDADDAASQGYYVGCRTQTQQARNSQIRFTHPRRRSL